MRSGWLIAGCVVLGVLVGCAVGASDDNGLDGLGSPDAGEDSARVKLPPSSQADSGTEDTGSPEEDSGTTDGGTTDGGTTDGGTTDGGTVPPSCAATNTCAAATTIQAISGDTNNDTRSVQGTTSQWFKVDVTEDVGGIFGNSLEMKAMLVSPAGANFDLYLYLPDTEGTRACSVVTASSKLTSGTDQAGLDWGEGAFANGAADTRTVTVEVRYVSGTCSPGAKWTLTLFGNQH